jgi:hypothetical protein
MAEDLDFEGLDPDKLEKFEKVMPGSYHAMLAGVEEYGGKTNDKLVFDWQIVTGTVDGMTGRSIKDQVPYKHDEWVRRKKAKLAFVLGLTTPEAAAKAKAAGQPLSIDWQDAVGRHCCIRVKGRKYTKEDGSEEETTQVGFSEDIFAINAPEAHGIPIDHAAIRAAYGGDDPFGQPPPAAGAKNGNGKTAPATAAPATAATASTKDRLPNPSDDDPFA